jgi:glutathione S-transferase
MNRIERVSVGDRPMAARRPPGRTRRSLPPELAHAIDLERLHWFIHLKAIAPEDIEVLARPRRLGVRLPTLDGGAPAAILGFGAAMAEIDRRWPTPVLMARDPALRARALAIERWLLGEVGAGVLSSLVQLMGAEWRPQQVSMPRVIMDAAAAATIRRALDLVSGLTQRHGYLLGNELSSADITAAAVLAPIARKDGWGWAGRTWTPLSAVAGRSDLAQHRGAAWVREIYQRHGERQCVAPETCYAWVP